MKLDICIRGTEQYHMENYLLYQGYIKYSCGIYRKNNVECRFISNQKQKIGKIEITEINIEFIGNDEVVIESDKFRSKFMTAGG